jgi:hypothetical protein
MCSCRQSFGDVGKEPGTGEPGLHPLYDPNEGIFYPGYRAQREGWRLIQARTWLQRWLLRAFF